MLLMIRIGRLVKHSFEVGDPCKELFIRQKYPGSTCEKNVQRGWKSASCGWVRGCSAAVSPRGRGGRWPVLTSTPSIAYMHTQALSFYECVSQKPRCTMVGLRRRPPPCFIHVPVPRAFSLLIMIHNHRKYYGGSLRERGIWSERPPSSGLAGVGSRPRVQKRGPHGRPLFPIDSATAPRGRYAPA